VDGALTGVRVLELADRTATTDRGGPQGLFGPPEADAASFATRLLGDLGAEVVLVEAEAESGSAASESPERAALADGMRQFLHWGKRSVVLDAGASARGRRDALVRSADIVVVGLHPTAARRAGCTAEELSTLNPVAVVTHVSPFGSDGPYADRTGSDLVLQAMSGVMAISGAADREPLKHGARTAVYSAGLNAAYASVAGLLSVERSGAGVVVDLAVRDCLTSELVMNNAFHEFAGLVQGRAPTVGDPLDGHPVTGGGGWMSLQTSARQPVEAFGRFFGDPRFDDERFSTPELRVANAAELSALIREHLAETPARELFERGSAAGLVIGFVQGPGDLLGCPHLAQRGVFAELPGATPAVRTWRLPAVLSELSRTPTRVRGPAPRPGEDTEAVLAELDTARADQPARVVVRSAGSDGPLAGTRVVDLSVIFAVPYMGGLLADLGADVVKVEAPRRIDQTRTDWGGYLDNDPGADPWNRSGTYQVVNRGKRSLGLDLSTHEGRDVLCRLVATADVLIDNFTPRVLPGWGLGHDVLAALNPRLVMLSNTGYGSTGPWAAYKAQGTTLEATMGLMAVTGYADGPPARAGQSVPDFYACWAGLLAICAALRHRGRTGQGQFIDLGMYQLGASVLPEALLHRQVHGVDLPRVGAADHDALVSSVVPSLDGWLAVSARTAEQLLSLRAVVGATHTGVEPALRAYAGGRSADEAATLLQAVGVPAGPVLDAGDLAEDPQLCERGFYEDVAVRVAGGRRRLVGRPYVWRSAGSEVGIRRQAPDFGADNDRVLTDLLGLDPGTVARLREHGVVADAPIDPPPARPMDVDLLLAKGTLARAVRTGAAL
jgi:crotonobetainyl-CoA:carnitine CoA-transferase CaiB-like acyl-CoA transferase